MPSTTERSETARRREAQVAYCSGCETEKPWSAFSVCKSRRPFGLASKCKECDRVRKQAVAARKRASLSIEERQLHDRRRNLRKCFGISLEEYGRMLEEQNGQCAICGNDEQDVHPATGKLQYLAVDHDHETGKIRGLLCGRCNKGLGLFYDNVNTLNAAINYLKRNIK